jgi:outer membrane protein assembly factor BamB
MLVWQTAIGTPNIGNVSLLAIANGVAYVGSLDNDLYALDAASGTLLWKIPTAVADGVVYFSILHRLTRKSTQRTLQPGLFNGVTKQGAQSTVHPLS